MVVGAFGQLGADQEAAIARLTPLYDERVRFQDPVQQLEGRDAFFAAMRRQRALMRSFRTEVLASSVSDTELFFSWRFSITPRFGPRLVVDGVSHLRHDRGHIVEQRDYFDLLSTLVASVPGVSSLYRLLVACKTR
jgi:limonene-1,2-epoxide hydrolase